MQTILAKNPIDYTGRGLRSRWIAETFGVEGDAIASFKGGCDVRPEYMVDLEDLAAGESIYSEEMLHFIIEHFGTGLKEMVLRQRLLTCIIKDLLEKEVPGTRFTRDGDDIFDGDCKLTVSIATKSPVSALIHTGINISSANTPVKTKGLKDYSIDPDTFASTIAECYKKESASIAHCLTKVREVS